ncbi:hypothetical protein BC828DRAFT_345579 [Blastocladiella britannica]|nr:hypothetical protein BC828DRAFT_345579 [Blastocladiella britannica]
MTPISVNVDDMSNEQVAMYAICMRIDEIGRLLYNGAGYIPTTPERSPSPEPTYGPDGKRTNTRENHYREKLEDERHRLVGMAQMLDREYRPPTNYRPPTKLSEKIYIPVAEFPHINFMGQLLGPRGSTLKKMSQDSGAKIQIRGKGSVKEGKGAPSSYQNQEEDMHCMITADTEAKVKIAVDMVNNIIETAVSVPEAMNDLKREQLRHLAELNGTLRDDEKRACSNCGAVGHLRYNCPERATLTSSITCRVCGNAGHMARDCMSRNNPEAMNMARERDTMFEAQYATLMADVAGGGPSAGGGGPGGMRFGGGGGGSGGGSAAPWARPAEQDAYDASGSSLPPWARGAQQQEAPSYDANAGGQPPWAAAAPSAVADPYAAQQQQQQQAATTTMADYEAAAAAAGMDIASYMAYVQQYYAQYGYGGAAQ